MISKSDFEKFLIDERFSRADPNGVLNIWYGVSGGFQPTLVLRSSHRLHQLTSTRYVEITLSYVKERKEWLLSFVLKDRELLSVFIHFCNDMISSTRNIRDEKEALSFFRKRYESWRRMLSAGVKEYLSEFQIQGLLGEFQFLLDYMIPKYGLEKAVQSWVGPRNSAQDFVVNNTWYEIKTVSSRVEKVSISSLSQLDSEVQGNLVIYRADKTSMSDSHAVNLNEQFTRLQTALMDYPDLSYSVRQWLLKLGYVPFDYYDEHVYSFKGKTFYQVTREFPALRRRDIPEAVINAKYDISIPSLESFKRDEE